MEGHRLAPLQSGRNLRPPVDVAAGGTQPESTARQYDLVSRARELGWPGSAVTVIDEDLGLSGASAAGRAGFAELAARVGMGQVGIVLSLEVSRLARNNTDWYRLLGAPRGAVYSCGDGRAPPPGRRSGLVKLEAA